MTAEKFSISVDGYGVVDRRVRSGTSSGRLHVPKAWIGKRVRIVLLEPPEEEKKE